VTQARRKSLDMNQFNQSSRKLIEGLYATRYLLILVVSMALTVIITRVYLEATGYPQLGNDTFHIAHALWGGLLLIIATVLMLVYLNQWVFFLSAILSGVGMGLFVDEIGKFITQTNDYFFPLAAPLIYVTVILLVLLYLLIRREDKYDVRSDMYIALESLKPILDQNIDRHEFDVLREQLDRLSTQTERPDIASLAQGMLGALPANPDGLLDSSADPFDRMINQAKAFEAKYFNQKLMRRILMFFFAIAGIGALLEIIALGIIIVDPQQLQEFVVSGIVIDNPLVNNPSSLSWYLGLIILSTIIGLLHLIALIAFLRRNEPLGTRVATVGLVLSLTVGNTMSFYFNQFSVMLTSIILFVVLVMVTRYRDRFLQAFKSQRFVSAHRKATAK